MPRINTSSDRPYDFCKECFPSIDLARKFYFYTLSGKDNPFVYGDKHPSYELSDSKCHNCERPLTKEDD